MTDEGFDPADGRHRAGPWWWGLGPLGGAVVAVIGVGVAVWHFFRLPGASDNVPNGYWQAARIIVIGLAVTGTTLLARRRARAAGTQKTEEQSAG
jgi:hypothetical protein